MSGQEAKRPREEGDDGGAAPAKQPRSEGEALAGARGAAQGGGSEPRPADDPGTAASSSAAAPAAEPLASGGLEEVDEFDAIFEAGDVGESELLEMARETPVPPEEQARKSFAAQLAAARQVGQEMLPELLSTLQTQAPSWGSLRRWRSVALLLVYVARSSRHCRAAFVAQGLPLLGALLQESVLGLETAGPIERQEAGYWGLACLACLRALPLGRATLWEHRASIGKPFDRLHKWCAREKSALAADLRGPTQALCRRWKREPKPAGQEHAPEQRALRCKVVDMIAQGLMGIAGINSPASPAPVAASPGMPPPMMATEVEAALFARHGSATPEYRQHARMLRSNLALAGNMELRNKVLSGDLEAAQLVAMDSSSLAPEELKKQRRESELKAMSDSVVKNVVLASHVPVTERSHSFSDRFLAATAPLATIAEDQEEQSSQGQAKSAPEGVEEGAAKAEASAAMPMVPPPTPFAMEPAPTPLRGAHDGHYAHGGHAHAEDDMAEALATPAVDDQNDEEEALMRHLSADVK